MTFNPSNTLGPFLPINQTFSEDDKQRLIQHTSRDREIARGVNIREIAIYDVTENPTGQQWENPNNSQLKRDGFRKVFTFGVINPGTSLVIAHGISGITIITRYWANVVTSIPDFRQVPYCDPGLNTNGIAMKVDSTNITIANGSTAPTITSGIAVLEYLKN